MTLRPERTIYIDPASSDYYGGRLFDPNDKVLNRDDYMRPYRQLRNHYRALGCELETADRIPAEPRSGHVADYYSFGMLENLDRLRARPDIRMRAMVIFEPPVVAPGLYDALPRLTSTFERVYVHNVTGDGYSLNGVDRSRLRKLYWPQQYDYVLAEHWQNETRARKLVLINNNKRPHRVAKELYSRRIEAASALSKLDAIDLYGGGWDRRLLKGGRFRRTIYGPAWRHHKWLRRAHRGAPASKYEALARYDVSLCMENMQMEGYLTEKLLDCLYSGTVPYYLGPPDVHRFVPKDVFIDLSRFEDWKDLWEHAKGLEAPEIRAYKEAGRAFVEGPASDSFKRSLIDIIA